MKLILFLCVCLVIVSIPFYLSRASFNLGLGPFFKLGIGYKKQKEKGNSLQSINREPVQIILKVIFSSLYFNYMIFLFLMFVPTFLYIYLKTNKSELFLGNSCYRRKSNNRHSSYQAIEYRTEPTNFKKRRSNCDE